MESDCCNRVNTGSLGEVELIVGVVMTVVLAVEEKAVSEPGMGGVTFGEPGSGGAGAPTIADRKVCIGSLGSVLAKVAAADSWDPSNVGKVGGGRGEGTRGGGAGEDIDAAISNGRSTVVESVTELCNEVSEMGVRCSPGCNGAWGEEKDSMSSSSALSPPSSSLPPPTPNSCSLVVRTAATVCASASATCLRLDLSWSTLDPASLGLWLEGVT